MNYELCKKIRYSNNFLNLILGLHKEYDAVFVHMNQEYILLGGFIWKILRKKIYMWRNHQLGSILTKIAVWFSSKVFCTSKFAFVAKYKKTKLMPVGINIERFKPFDNAQGGDLKIERLKNSVLFLGRMAPVKKPDLLIEALDILNRKNVDFICDFYGDALPKDEDYYENLKKRASQLGLDKKINFHKAVPNYETPKIYNEHNIFINLTPSGSFDKTIFEAATCGNLVIVANQSFVGEIDERMIIKESSSDKIAEKLKFWLTSNEDLIKKTTSDLQNYVKNNHSQDLLIKILANEMQLPNTDLAI